MPGRGLTALVCALVAFVASGDALAGVPGTQKWAFQAGVDMWSSPAIGADGTIYVGSDDNRLHAINPDGTQKK